eukprot:15446852-Alexandrium_andersonii.AAC.1
MLGSSLRYASRRTLNCPTVIRTRSSKVGRVPGEECLGHKLWLRCVSGLVVQPSDDGGHEGCRLRCLDAWERRPTIWCHSGTHSVVPVGD